MAKKRQSYIGFVEEIHPTYVLAVVNVGRAELSLQFPRKIMEYHELYERGKTFNWYPSKDGEVSIPDVKPRKAPRMNLKALAKGLERLCNPKQIDKL